MLKLAKQLKHSHQISDELGWQPKEGFDSGFRKTVKWYLENKDWWEQILSGNYKLDRFESHLCTSKPWHVRSPLLRISTF